MNPYEAPNGAFCANFNTVAFEKKKDGTLASAEPQTPLLPFAIERIQQKNPSSGRIVLTHVRRECALYAGHLTAHFLREFGVSPLEKIEMAQTPPNAPAFYVYESTWTLTDLIARLMEFSNNFMANQLLLAAAAKATGPPASLDKAVDLAKTHAAHRLGISPFQIVEGSGISRQNRVSAKMMAVVLKAFAPHYLLLQNKGPVYFKTGTLFHVQTRAGYVVGSGNQMFLFAIMINTPEKQQTR